MEPHIVGKCEKCEALFCNLDNEVCPICGGVLVVAVVYWDNYEDIDEGDEHVEVIKDVFQVIR